MSEDFFQEKRPHRGFTYEEYIGLMEDEARAAEQAETNGKPLGRLQYMKLNLQRTKRIGKVYTPSDSIRTIVEATPGPRLWMVLTEPWCGDSAQCLPYIAKIARCGGNIDLRVLRRDENLDIMDQYLTNGTRSVPLLVAFEMDGTELFRWGPRPQPAAELFLTHKDAGHEKERILKELHRWYAKDRGCTIEEEIKSLLNGNSST